MQLPENKKLRYKEQRFIEEYPVDFNATKAALRAEYSPKTASVIGYENLKKPHIQQALAEHLRELTTKAQVTVDRVLEELSSVGFCILDDYMSWDEAGNTKLKASKDLTRAQKAAISEVQSTSFGENGSYIKLKFHSKLGALKQLERYLELGGMGMVPWNEVLDALAEMARIVELYVPDDETLMRIKDGWARIPLRPQRLVTNGSTH